MAPTHDGAASLSTPALTRDTGSRALEALRVHGTYTRAAAALGVPISTFRSRCARAIQLGHDAPPPVLEVSPDPGLAFEDAWGRWCHAIGRARDHVAHPPDPQTGARQRILVVPDLHVPFHEPEMLARMIATERADTCLLIGDLTDSYALSTYTRYDRVPPREEWAQCLAVLQALAEAYPRVLVLQGNHDNRLEKRVRQHLTEDMVEAILLLTGGTLCPVTAMTTRFENVSMAGHVTPTGARVGWCTTIGDAWFGHPERFSRVPGSALRAVEEWLVDNEVSLGFTEARLVVMGHTHQAGLFPWKSGKLLAEAGCLCQQQGYMLSPSLGGRPQRRGYLTLEQVDGKTDLNSVKFTWLDVV